MNGAITTEFDPNADAEKLAALMAEIKPLRRHRRGGGRHPAKSLRPLSPPPAWPRVSSPLNVALLDLGCKKNIVRCLCKRGCRVTVLPGTATAADLAALHATA